MIHKIAKTELVVLLVESFATVKPLYLESEKAGFHVHIEKVDGASSLRAVLNLSQLVDRGYQDLGLLAYYSLQDGLILVENLPEC